MEEIGKSESEAGNGHFLSTTMSTKETEIDQDIPDQIITTLANCSLPTPFESDRFNEVTAILCGLYLFFGLFCALFGYRCFKAIMFLTGFIFGSIIVYLICLEEQILPMWANTLIAVSAGLLFGLITLLVQYVGIFMLGFHGGLLLGLLGLVASDTIAAAVNNAHNYHSPWISVAVLLSTGLVVSLFNLYFQVSLFLGQLNGSNAMHLVPPYARVTLLPGPMHFLLKMPTTQLNFNSGITLSYLFFAEIADDILLRFVWRGSSGYRPRLLRGELSNVALGVGQG